MAIISLQDTGQVTFSQSPMIYAVSESNAEAFTSSSFQYVLEVYYWTGSILTDQPATSQYTLQKFPSHDRCWYL